MFGHQIRAFGGTFIKRQNGKKEPSVTRCESMGEGD